MLTEKERLARLRLARTKNIGPMTFHALLARFGSAEKALAALPDFTSRSGRRGFTPFAEAKARAEQDHLHALDGKFLHWGEPGYPPALAAMDDAPPILSLIGERAILDRPCIALVGTRNASAAALAMAGKIAGELAEADCTIVSGMARGIDSRAHYASLSGGTCAVLAGGVDVIYPPENKELYREICTTGCVVSEMPMGFAPVAQHFPRRNRIIAGLALVVVVVEAPRRSGSMITARLAAEMGRLVCAVPGSPADPRTHGTNHLIREGAVLVTSSADILQELTPLVREPPQPVYAPVPDGIPVEDIDESMRGQVSSLLSPAPMAIDDIIRAADMPTSAVLTILLEMEIAGKIIRTTGQKVSLTP